MDSAITVAGTVLKREPDIGVPDLEVWSGQPADLDGILVFARRYKRISRCCVSIYAVGSNEAGRVKVNSLASGWGGSWPEACAAMLEALDARFSGFRRSVAA